MNARSIVFVGLLLVAICFFPRESLRARNPLKGSEAEIRAWVLEKTPLGSTRKQVITTIQREHWSYLPYFVGSSGVREWGNHRHFKCCGELGRYHAFYPPFFIFPCRAFACWLFGSDDRLTQVFTSSGCEGL